VGATEWLLFISVLNSLPESPFDKEYYFNNESHCVFAAKEFVKQYPEFKWVNHQTPDVDQAVLQSYVKCIKKPVRKK
jgi:hypothetical protein